MMTHAILVVGQRGAVRLCKEAPPRVRQGEIAMRLAIQVPDKCFTSPLVNVDVAVVDVVSAEGPE
jgi:hypothetical protein